MSFTDSELQAIFTNAPRDKQMLEVVSLKADWFSKDYHLQSQVTGGIDVTLDVGGTVTAEYAPMNLTQASSNADLSYSRSIVLQQVNDIISSELDNFDPVTDDLPYLEARVFVIYEDGTVSSQKETTITLPVSELAINEEGAQITATTTPIDDSATGELATVERNPLFRGLL